MYALIFNEKVIQIENEPFEVHKDLKWVEITNDSVQVGWYYDGNSFFEQPVKKVSTEALARSVRVSRNTKLQKSDWIVVKYKELGKAVPAAWKSYRQALRDIPTQEGFPHDVTFPEEPTES